MQIEQPVTPGDEPPHPGVPTAVAEPPAEFVDAGNEYRLIRELRGRARWQNPALALAHSAVEFLKSERAAQSERAAVTRLATALADLAVTGRQSYGQFSNGISMLSLEGHVRERLEAQRLSPPPTDTEIRAAMDLALDRAYEVAWALRGPVEQREALRARLGWIAVSAEDDMPHRPVNLPAPPFEQYEVQVRTPLAGGGFPLWTRYLVACAGGVYSTGEPLPTRPVRRVPRDPVPFIPADHVVLLFLHGHSSGADEALDLIPHLLDQGLRRGTKYAVISCDLPNNGYSQVFDHSRIAPAEATTFPYFFDNTTPIATPILDFIEDFVVAFVDAVEGATSRSGAPRIKHRIAAVIGGSLGGNLGLRLGRRSPMPSWLRNVVAWSPASVWKAKVKHDPGREGSNATRHRFLSEATELESSRRDYFNRVYDKHEGPIKPQPEYWYGPSFPHAAAYKQLSRVSRREIYNPFYRLWHWRVACEQLIYSHVENVVYGDSSTPARYTLNTVRTLLGAGEEDNALYVGIYGATAKLGALMTATPGRLLLVRNTGHSMHAERPRYFASEIVGFLAPNLPRFSPTESAALSALLLDDPEADRVDGSRKDAARATSAAISLLLLDPPS